MTDAPLAAAGVAEQAGGREEEPAPAPHPQGGVLAIDAALDAFDLIAMRIEIGESVERRALVMLSALPVRCWTIHAHAIRIESDNAIAAGASRYKIIENPR